MKIEQKIEELAQRMTGRVAGYPIDVALNHEGLTIQDYRGDWTIHVTVDEESARWCEDEPFASPAVNSSGVFHDPEMGRAVDRHYSATSMEAHERMVLRWMNSYRAKVQGFEHDAPGPMDTDGNIHYQDSTPDTVYDGFDSMIGVIEEYHTR